MRRKEREVTDKNSLRKIIESCHCMRVGFSDGGHVYIVPMNFGYMYEDEKLTFYFHSAKEGRKMALIKENPTVGFEMDTGYELKTAAAACAHSAYFQSVIGEGKVCVVEDTEEKKKGLCAVMEHETGSRDWEFQDKMVQAVCVWKLTVSEIAGKEQVHNE